MKQVAAICVAKFVALLLSCAIPVGGGAPPAKSVSSSLSPKEAKQLRESLARLEKVLKEKAKKVHAELAPPATDADIDRLRAELNGSTVESLELWYRWHNGMPDYAAELIPLGRPNSIDEAIADRGVLKGQLDAGTPHQSMIKLLADGFGDGYFLDTTSSKLTVFYEMIEDPTGGGTRFTLTEFVDFIAAAYEQGILVDDPRNTAPDFEKFQRFEVEFLRKRRSEKSDAEGGNAAADATPADSDE
jgi:hypothetical protein